MSERPEREIQVPRGDRMEGFDQDFINRIKTGFKPLFVRNPLTTVYQQLPSAIYNVKPGDYQPRSLMLGFAWGLHFFLLNNIGLEDLHCSAHMASILSRNPSITFENYLAAMNGLRREIEACHLVKPKVDITNLIVLVLNCCQIIDLLLLFHEGRLTSEVDRICSSEINTWWVDLLLIMNQVPFFALQKMYDMVVGDHHNMAAQQIPSLVDLSLHFFEQFLDLNKDLAPPLESNSIHHLLHLVHYYLLPQNNPPPSPPSSKKPSHHIRLIRESIPSARRLKEVGVRFRAKNDPGFSNITFHKGVLQLPFLRIDNNTEIILRNMVAWEQCHFNVGGYFTSYCIFMDYLVNAVEDVHILQNERIIEQRLGSEEQVASLFNGLSTNIAYIAYENDFLLGLYRDLNNYCGNRFNLWRAKLLVDYFSSPWAIISVIAAIFLLLMTAIQTFYTAYAYHRPH
ncbi:hypothetical protein H6P81_016955 [Aristolochia fimbriata]|uniref:Uncharacterized protein n=1 Tax=Aristolochia fimbriata TaxID=158543 RepID=A0AAV7DZT1_ARIFI|nr:hypothetical protein H6P81_016955 [Aristolochia fimbriata]